MRSQHFSIVLCLFLACSSSLAADAPAPATAPSAAAPSAAAAEAERLERELAGATREVEAAERSLADLRAKADALRLKVLAARAPASSEVAFTSVQQMFDALPEGARMQRRDDNIREARMYAWLNENVAGKRARLRAPFTLVPLRQVNEPVMKEDRGGGYWARLVGGVRASIGTYPVAAEILVDFRHLDEEAGVALNDTFLPKPREVVIEGRVERVAKNQFGAPSVQFADVTIDGKPVRQSEPGAAAGR